MLNPTALLDKFDKAKIEVWKHNFRARYYKLNEEEREKYRKGEIPMICMTPEKVHKIMGFLEKCGTAFQVEAMERIIIDEYMVPEDFKEIEELADDLRDRALHGT
jgi:hypothetical protein